jgi:lipoprotein signal peptidase
MTERTYIPLLWGLALLGTALDQGSKYGVFKWLYDGQAGPRYYQVVPGVFELLSQYTNSGDDQGPLATLRTLSSDKLPRVNQGALFGFGHEHGNWANAIFAGISICAAAAIVVWSRRQSTARDPALCSALGLILAGTLGNLYDRIVFHGVRDFFHFYWFEWPVFNVADCCLVCGAFLLLAQAFWSRPLHESEVSSPAGQVAEVK